jgi:hypothetical protein
LNARNDDNWANVQSFWSGKGKGASGGTEFQQITNQTLFGPWATAVYDGTLFVGCWPTQIFGNMEMEPLST